jgi:NAD(P)-dependent dehydrogenase (short-subunit alcohol dehydrogenase family)
MSMFDLTGQKAIVTGGGQGLGREMAMALAEAGADVALAQRRVEVAEKTAEEIRETGREAIALQVDVTRREDVQEMVDAAKGKFGKIDILINNAGIGGGSPPLLDVSEEEWDRMMNIHLKGTMLCSQAVGKEMAGEKKGSIINISSISGYIVNRPQHQTSYNTVQYTGKRDCTRLF